MPPVTIIYEDAFTVAVNKPAGLIVHGDGKKEEPVLTDWILEHYPQTKTVGEPMFVGSKELARPGIVHRLDRETSGVMAVARHQESFAALKEIFQKRLAEKTSHAIICGIPKEKTGMITLPIGRLSRDPTKRGVVAGRTIIRGARDAATAYRVLKTGNGTVLVELKPKTGRIHQLRVHMSAIHHPIACDIKYGGKNVYCPAGNGGGASPCRQLLHAQSLSFTYPESRKLSFEADPPPDFALAMEAFF